MYSKQIQQYIIIVKLHRVFPSH